MKKLLALSLICCLVLTMSTPASAGDYFFEKDVCASDLVDELITYVKNNCSMDDWWRQLSEHKVKEWKETKKGHAFDLKFTCNDTYYQFIPMPVPLLFPETYEFTGEMHVKDKRKMTQNYTLTITDDDRAFTATGKGWTLKVREGRHTRFKA